MNTFRPGTVELWGPHCLPTALDMRPGPKFYPFSKMFRLELVGPEAVFGDLKSILSLQS